MVMRRDQDQDQDHHHDITHDTFLGTPTGIHLGARSLPDIIPADIMRLLPM
jgi:hypothetical protein